MMSDKSYNLPTEKEAWALGAAFARDPQQGDRQSPFKSQTMSDAFYQGWDWSLENVYLKEDQLTLHGILENRKRLGYYDFDRTSVRLNMSETEAKAKAAAQLDLLHTLEAEQRDNIHGE